MPSYSFLDVTASITGPGGSFDLIGCNADEGITIDQVNDKNVMTPGADGCVMHSLRAEDSGTVTIRLLKTSSINAQLQQLYNSQKDSSATWGQNTISIKDIARGDDITCEEVAFKRQAPLTYATEGGINEWTFDAARIKRSLGGR